MDWKKLDFDEIGFVFKSTRSKMDFKCLPWTEHRIAAIIDMLSYYQIESFQSKDIYTLFDILHVISVSGKVILPKLDKIQKILVKLSGSGIVSQGIDFVIDHQAKEFGIYPRGIYQDALMAGRKKQFFIPDWITYALINEDVCEMNIRKKLP